ncbi:MAG: flagellar filament capping protein FliD [Phycisphaerae bacterium]|nr:flagellar filament capping protein FliD [Phycisphaerae bacterium]
MGTISSGTGLISGLDTATLIEKLMAIEARPRTLLQNQVSGLDSVKTAWATLSAQLLGLKSNTSTFNKEATFQAVKAASTNTDALTVSADAGAVAGVYQFTPARMVANHQVVSGGFRDSDTTAVGAGTISIDLGHGQLNPTTDLEALNGGAGVARGSIKVSDRSGASATISLKTAVSVQDVLDAINGAGGISVTASVSGDTIVLTDTSGSIANNLKVEEVNNGSTAADLGILASVAANTLAGDDVVSVNASTALSLLNDGNGLRTVAGNDIKFTLENGAELQVDLSSALTLGDVIDTINGATGNSGKLVASVDSGSDGLKLQDTTGGPGTLTVAAVGGSKAAADLGLLGSDGDADHVIHGRRLLAGLNTVLLRNLNGGAGVTAGAISIQDRGTGSAVVDLSAAQTVQDVLDAVNAAAGVSAHAALNTSGNGIVITDTSGQTLRNFVIAESGGTTAAGLNILHDAADTSASSGHLEHRYVSENSLLDDLGVAHGKFKITDSAGHAATVDLTQGDEKTLGKVIDEINSRGIGVTASINDAGNGLLLTDTAGGAGTLTVVEAGSTTAKDLGILGSDGDADHTIDGSRRIDVAVAADDTLADVALKINNATSALSATVIKDGSAANPYRLVLSSTIGGQAGRMTLDTGATGLSFSTMTQPQDALVFLGDPASRDSIAIHSRSNAITDVIDHVTLNVAGTSDTPVTITVSSTIDTLVNQLKSFATSFNSTISQINTATAYDAEAGTKGLLQGDNTANRVRTQLFRMVTGSVEGAPGSYSRLTQIGFSVTNDGTQISFDESKFRAAYASDPAGVKGLFLQADSGIGDRVDTLLTQLTDSTNGTIQTQLDGLDSRETVLNDRIAVLNKILSNKQARLQRQFNAMEQALASLQSQSSALSALASAASFYTTWGSSSSSSSG